MDKVTLGATFALYCKTGMFIFSFAPVKNVTLLKLRGNIVVFPSLYCS